MPLVWLRRSLRGIPVAVAKKIRTVLVAAALTLAIVAAANYAPLLSMHSEQDNCSFGPVTNQQYRAYLSEVRRRQAAIWPSFDQDTQNIYRLLNVRLSDMLGGESSLYTRIAIMHAILRGIGAEYLNANGVPDKNPYEAALLRGGDVTFNYQVDINRLVSFQLYPRQVWIGAVILEPQSTTDRSIPRKFKDQHFFANIVSVFDHPPASVLTRSDQNCPPMPTKEFADRYDSHQR
jgi:hypothetical protein